MFRQTCILFFIFYLLSQPGWLGAAINRSGTSPKNPTDSTTKVAAPEINYAIGLYAGANDAVFNTNGSFNINTSYLIYSLFDLNHRMELLVGMGQIGFSGKSLGYIDSKKEYNDTVAVKKYSVNRVNYFTVPVMLKIKLDQRFKLGVGIRFSVVNQTGGTGTAAYYLGSRPDSIIIQSQISPGLPQMANKYDFGGILGIEYCLNKNCWISIMVNSGLNPIYPSAISDIYGQRAGNYNISTELGLHYLFYNNHHKIE